MCRRASKKMQSETADFAPVPPPGELEETYASSLILPTRSIMYKHDFIYKTGSTYHIALPSEDDRAMVTGNMDRKSYRIWTCA